jgi:hypothetical protein
MLPTFQIDGNWIDCCGKNVETITHSLISIAAVHFRDESTASTNEKTPASMAQPGLRSPSFRNAETATFAV